MNLALEVHPYAWALTLPLAALFIWLGCQKPQHPLRVMWRQLMEWDAEVFSSMTGGDLAHDPTRRAVIQRSIYWTVCGAFSLNAALSLGAYFGVM